MLWNGQANTEVSETFADVHLRPRMRRQCDSVFFGGRIQSRQDTRFRKMGGFRSGRGGGRKKCEATPRLGVADLLKYPWVPDGFLIPGSFGRNYCFEINRQGDRVLLEAYWLEPRRVFEVRLYRHPQPFGGARCYLLCPWCGGRSVHVYWRKGVFACRHCLRLAYTSQSETAMSRAGRRFRKRKQIIGNADRKPYRMRQETFLEFRREYLRRRDIVYRLWMPQALRVLRGKCA